MVRLHQILHIPGSRPRNRDVVRRLIRRPGLSTGVHKNPLAGRSLGAVDGRAVAMLQVKQAVHLECDQTTVSHRDRQQPIFFIKRHHSGKLAVHDAFGLPTRWRSD